MPGSWSNKRERQYEHIKRSARRRGRSAAVAKRIAAATTNKTRRMKGETKSRGESRGRTSTSRRRTMRRMRTAAGRKGGRARGRA
jgi:hypothetical protein